VASPLFSVSGYVRPLPSPPHLGPGAAALFTRVSCPIPALCRSSCPTAIRAARTCVASTSMGWPVPTALPGSTVGLRRTLAGRLAKPPWPG
jgi:hypothetical protein